jgi:hypothetical protein
LKYCCFCLLVLLRISLCVWLMRESDFLAAKFRLIAAKLKARHFEMCLTEILGAVMLIWNSITTKQKTKLLSLQKMRSSSPSLLSLPPFSLSLRTLSRFAHGSLPSSRGLLRKTAPTGMRGSSACQHVMSACLRVAAPSRQPQNLCRGVYLNSR